MADVFDDNKSTAQKVVDQLRNLGRTTRENMRRAAVEGAILVWRNRHATPAAVVAAMGADAVKFFDRHAELVAFLAPNDDTLMPELAKIVGKYTRNDDGTITIVE